LPEGVYICPVGILPEKFWEKGSIIGIDDRIQRAGKHIKKHAINNQRVFCQKCGRTVKGNETQD
jgi:hypothetical protein